MSSELGSWIENLLPPEGLSPAHQRVHEAVAGNHQLASYCEIAEIALRAGVDNSTVVRFAQRVGFRGWPSLQQELRARYLASLSTEQTLEEHAYDGVGVVQDAIRHDMENLRRALDTIDPDTADLVVKALAAAQRITTVAMGSSAGPATVFAHLGTTMGYDVAVESRGGANLATALNRLREGDVLVVINVWRPMSDLLAAARAARAVGVTVVAITDMHRGVLASTADHVLVVPSEGVSFFQSVTATTSVVYGLLAGMRQAQPDRSREAMQHMQRLWRAVGTYSD